MRSRLVSGGKLDVEELPPRALAPGVRERVRTLFEAEQRERGGAPETLYDGPLFSLCELEGSRATGRFVAYSEWVAQLREPSLRAQLDIRPLGVTGATRCGDGVVFGLRAHDTFHHPGCWELAPSGGVDFDAREPGGRIAPLRQLLLELEEELDWPADRVRPARPYALVSDPTLGIVDVVYELVPDASAAELEAAFSARTSREYSEVRCVGLSSLDAFLRDEAARMSPVVHDMLRLRGWLGPAPPAR